MNTSVSILNCPILRDTDGHKEMVRYYIIIDVFPLVYCLLVEMVCRWYSKVLHRRSCWSGNICHISTDNVFTTNNSSGGCCDGKSEGV